MTPNNNPAVATVAASPANVATSGSAAAAASSATTTTATTVDITTTQTTGTPTIVSSRNSSSQFENNSSNANGYSDVGTCDAPSSNTDSCCNYFFLSKRQSRAELASFRYRGQDLSIVYRYVLSPVAEWLVRHATPRSVAPNTITLTGLAFMVIAYCAMWYHVPMVLLQPQQHHPHREGGGEAAYDAVPDAPDCVVPRWVFLLNAVAILIYQTLDNMDGKQARRVGASSPLGLLFDHGCDAVNSLFGSANWMVSMALTATNRADIYLCFAVLFGPYGLFYIGTWEEYHTGQLIMPLVNGPNEGLLGAVAMSLLSYAYGPEYWHTHSWWDAAIEPWLGPVLESWTPTPLRNADLLVLASSVGFVQEIVLKAASVVRRYGVRALGDLIPFATLVGSALLVGLVDVQIWLDTPRTSLHLCAFLFVEMTTELMLTHMTKQRYQPVRWILLPLVIFTAGVATGMLSRDGTAPYLLVYSTSAGTYLTMKTVILIHEICNVLNIWCFDIVTPRNKRRGAIKVE
jgi:ethanolaminephosphotransferase